MDIGQQILTLKRDIDKAASLRATAEGSLAVAQQQVQEIDAKLQALGITPDDFDVELAALDAELVVLVASLEAMVAQEIQTYSEIVAASKAAFQGETR